MKTLTRNATSALMFASVLTGFFGGGNAEACSRIVYEGNNNLFIVGRSLDWRAPIPTNLYVYPRGIKKQGNVQTNSVEWTSQYGAVYAVSYDGGVTEGMNEKGLVVNGLFCKGTVYSNAEVENRAPISLAVFVAWILDTNATTDEAVEMLKKHDFNISGATFDGGTVSALHWAITDASGKTAIIEFDNGVIKIYDDADIRTLTNDPTFPQMQAINNYWKAVGGHNMLPGSVKSPDRFVRADYFIHHVQPTDNPDLAVSIARSVLVTVSVPYTYTVESEPNVSSTQWRSFADLKNHRYYFDMVTNNGIYYIDLNKCNLSKGSPVMKLDTSKSQYYIGDVTSKLKKHPPFTPMY